MRKLSPLKRMPISLSHDLHTRFKTQCAGDGVLMSEVIRRPFEREYTNTPHSRRSPRAPLASAPPRRENGRRGANATAGIPKGGASQAPR
jgi:hypothetical protein